MMTSKITHAAAMSAALSLMLACGAANAADTGEIAGSVAASLASFGQGLGDAVTGAPSVFVTATGHAKRLHVAVKGFGVSLQSKAQTASEAVDERDRAVDLAKSIAAKFDVDVIGESETMTRGDEGGLGDAMAAARMATGVAGVDQIVNASGKASTAKQFVAHATLNFHVHDSPEAGAHIGRKKAAFLDALVSAGLDFELDGQRSGFVFNPLANLSLGGDEIVDEATWDQASADAMAEARRQAAVLAAAAGRSLGEARQVLQLLKTAQDDKVNVTVAVRYSLAAPH